MPVNSTPNEFDNNLKCLIHALMHISFVYNFNGKKTSCLILYRLAHRLSIRVYLSQLSTRSEFNKIWKRVSLLKSTTCVYGFHTIRNKLLFVVVSTSSVLALIFIEKEYEVLDICSVINLVKATVNP